MLARKGLLNSFLRSAKTDVARWHGLLIGHGDYVPVPYCEYRSLNHGSAEFE